MGRRARYNPVPNAPFSVVGLQYPANQFKVIWARLGGQMPFTGAPGAYDSNATLDPQKCPLCNAETRWERAYHPSDTYVWEGKAKAHSMIFARCQMHGRSDTWGTPKANPQPTHVEPTTTKTEEKPMPGSLDAIVDERISTVVGDRLASLEAKSGLSADEIAKIARDAVEQSRKVEITSIAHPQYNFTGTAHPLLAKVLKYIEAGEWLFYIWGPMGSGKTTLAFQVAEYLKRPMCATSFTVTTPLEEVKGYHNPVTDKYQPSTLIEGFENGAVCLIDDGDRASANTLTGLNAIEQGKIFVPRTGKPEAVRTPETILFVTANTSGNGANGTYAGAEQLDAAFTGRFRMLYAGVDRAVEIAACGGDDVAVKVIDACEQARKRADESKVRRVVCLRMARRAATDTRLDPDKTPRMHLKEQCRDAGWTETELNGVWC